MDSRPRVALLIESSRAYGRGLLRGIAAYIRNHRRWSIFHQERGMSEGPPPWLKGWKGDGIIARIEHPLLVRALRRTRIPVVDLRGMHDLPGIPLIETDDRAVTQLAVNHLMERGFKRLAFCGYQGANFSVRRLLYFRELIEAKKMESWCYEAPRTARLVTAEIEGRGLMYERTLAAWVGSLPRPIAVLACNDVRGQQLINACRDLGIAVPDDVAVIGVDNDELICDLSDPPLTSVEPNTERIGYESAALLDQLMARRAATAAPRRGDHRKKVFIEPLRVVTRQSTDVVAIADRQLAAAVRYIRQFACDGIGVDAVTQHAGLSRSTLERRFHEVLRTTPKAEIMRVRIERAMELLRGTDFPLTKIADLSGFLHQESLCKMFKLKTGATPGQYRRQAGAARPGKVTT